MFGRKERTRRNGRNRNGTLLWRWDLSPTSTFRLFRSFRLFHFRPHKTRSTSAKRNTVTDITPFMVKNAASSRDNSPGRTSWCS